MPQGVKPERLVAAGFGKYQPLDPATSDEALRNNRRIELKLTERYCVVYQTIKNGPKVSVTMQRV
jgi:hypothetical protein